MITRTAYRHATSSRGAHLLSRNIPIHPLEVSPCTRTEISEVHELHGTGEHPDQPLLSQFLDHQLAACSDTNYSCCRKLLRNVCKYFSTQTRNGTI
jgi:hypothetical protein